MENKDEMLLEDVEKGAKEKIGHQTNRGPVPKMGKHSEVSEQWGQINMSCQCYKP
jgi:hypothetical protein